MIVPRTCSRFNNQDGETITRRPLESFRDQNAYVLLGDPGAGKTSVFDAEAKASGAVYIIARDFLALEPNPEWHDKVLFIDGLDETRAGGTDGKTPLDRIREKLDKLGRPRFRLSCREADWLGASDRGALARVSPDGETSVLHLDPLTDEQIISILGERTNKPNEFFRAAVDHGLGGMLYNPQTLLLLINAVKDDQWPDTRQGTFEMACRALVQELNPEHRRAKSANQANSEELLEAAGYLCAVQLLSGTVGFATDGSATDAGFVDIDHLVQSVAPLRDAVKTNLFKGSGEERRVPIHRSVAEYLAARYLTSCIENDGLSLGRVLALMLGTDGGVVADLRGLHAWLTTHYKSERQSLIMNDALGVVLYGDVRKFSEAEKRLILEGLNQAAKRYAGFRWENWSSSPFGALGTVDMVPTFRGILESPSRADSDQALADCVLDALEFGASLPEMTGVLLNVVRDATRWPRVRHGALKVVFRNTPLDTQNIIALLNDVHTGRVEDRDDELLGMLLEKLYPALIGVDRILDYLRVRNNLELIGSYFDFWSRKMPALTPNEHLPQLLDELQKKDLTLGGAAAEHHIAKMAGTLVVKGVELFGATIVPSRLYEWLGIGLDRYSHRSFEEEHRRKIREWLSAHPEQYKSLIFHSVAGYLTEEELDQALRKCHTRLLYADPPEDLGMWYLKQSDLASDEKLSHLFFKHAFFSLVSQRGSSGLSFELFESKASKSPKHRQWFEPLLYCDISGWQFEHAEQNEKYRREQKSRKSAWIGEYRKHLSTVRDGSAPPHVLHNLGAAYFGHIYEASGENALERLNDFFDNDQELVDAALQGFRRVLLRGDLPQPSEIFDLDAKGRMHYIRLPCLVGIAELYKDDPSQVIGMGDSILSKVLAFHFTYGVGSDPEWYIALVKNCPDLVAGVLTAYALRSLLAGKEHVTGIYALAHDESFGEVARGAVPSLLDGFPAKARKGQLQSLEYILKGGLRHLQNSELSPIINKKLALRSMDIGQRIYWMACGLVVSPEKYEAKLRKYVGKNRSRTRHLAGFLSSRTDKWVVNRDLPASSFGLLIELLGPDCSPDRPVGAYWVTEAMQTADVVASYIHRLGSSPTKSAAEELDALLKKTELKQWHSGLGQARESQRVSQREATFLRPTLDGVIKTLANLQPTNAADLAALAYDHLRQIGRKIRLDNTDPYKLFWNEDSNGNPLTPKPENSCRDVLLIWLRDRLAKIGIDAQPEPEYANNKRADIRVSFGGGNGFNVPIEIKRATHDDLWRAMREQLIARYARDIGADGHGIYLVLWFGDVTPAPGGGRKPSDPTELEALLLGLLEPHERSRILVLVIDCAAPSRTVRRIELDAKTQ